jgi:hypothetical protein
MAKKHKEDTQLHQENMTKHIADVTQLRILAYKYKNLQTYFKHNQHIIEVTFAYNCQCNSLSYPNNYSCETAATITTRHMLIHEQSYIAHLTLYFGLDKEIVNNKYESFMKKQGLPPTPKSAPDNLELLHDLHPDKKNLHRPTCHSPPRHS